MNGLKKLKEIAGECYKQYCDVNEYLCARLTVRGADIWPMYIKSMPQG